MSKFALILSFFIALFMSACTNATFTQSFIQTSNEGIFIRSQKQQSFKISFQNPSQLQTTLDRDLALKLKNLGLKEVKENADYENFNQSCRYEKAFLCSKNHNFSKIFL